MRSSPSPQTRQRKAAWSAQTLSDRPKPKLDQVAHVRFGSKADIGLAPADVRFTPKSGHCRTTLGCPLFAKKQTNALQQTAA
jgi:hypothetical protein